MTAPTVLLLGGTTEARALAEQLVSTADVTVISSLAGRVTRPALPVGDVRIGGFGGVDGLASWIAAEQISAVVDATHPFAATISHHAVLACARTSTPLLRLEREAWSPGPGDDWRTVPDLAAAAALLPDLGQRVFLTTGRQDVAVFADSPGWFLIRCVDPPTATLPAQSEVLLARGPYDADAERALMQQHGIDVLVTKNSGGEATIGKLTAARELGIPVVMVSRPPAPSGSSVPSCSSVDDAASWVRQLRSTEA